MQSIYGLWSNSPTRRSIRNLCPRDCANLLVKISYDMFVQNNYQFEEFNYAFTLSSPSSPTYEIKILSTYARNLLSFFCFLTPRWRYCSFNGDDNSLIVMTHATLPIRFYCVILTLPPFLYLHQSITDNHIKTRRHA